MLRITLAESSYLIRKGIISVLNEIGINADIKEISGADEFNNITTSFVPDVIIINTTISSMPNVDSILSNCDEEVEIISIFNSPLPKQSSANTISVFDSKSTLLIKLKSLIKNKVKIDQEDNTTEEISDREKDVLKEIALGRTNKEIASNLFISSHTVISHRKNITRKLGIKTVSGLTVYAILNGIMAVEDIS